MATNRNYEKYPHNLFPPRKITVNRSEYNYYLVRFNNLYEIYKYLKSDPYVNRSIFRTLSSREARPEFAGMPYVKAVEDLINLNDQVYFNFVDLVKDIAYAKTGTTHKYRTVRTLAGGHLNIPLYSAGSPYCYETQEQIKRPKFVNIYSALSYSSNTSKYQVFNRAVILISIISALEKQGYKINLNAFEMSTCGNEIVNNVVGIKSYTDQTNLQTLYKTSCKVEFLRRIMFGVLETVDVKNEWGAGYGRTAKEDFAKSVLNVGKDDIYFGTPQELGVGGGSIEKDFKNCLANLKLDGNISVGEIGEDFQKQLKKVIS